MSDDEATDDEAPAVEDDLQNMVATQQGYEGDVPQAAAAAGGAGLTLSRDDEEYKYHIPYDDGKSAAYAFGRGTRPKEGWSGGWFGFQGSPGFVARLALIVDVKKHGFFARTMHTGGILIRRAGHEDLYVMPEGQHERGEGLAPYATKARLRGGDIILLLDRRGSTVRDLPDCKEVEDWVFSVEESLDGRWNHHHRKAAPRPATAEPAADTDGGVAADTSVGADESNTGVAGFVFSEDPIIRSKQELLLRGAVQLGTARTPRGAESMFGRVLKEGKQVHGKDDHRKIDKRREGRAIDNAVARGKKRERIDQSNNRRGRHLQDQQNGKPRKPSKRYASAQVQHLRSVKTRLKDHRNAPIRAVPGVTAGAQILLTSLSANDIKYANAETKTKPKRRRDKKGAKRRRRDGQGADVHFEIDIDGIDDDQEESSSGDDGLRSIDAALPTSRC